MKFDEIKTGKIAESGTYIMGKQEIIEFASQYDPQYMHINEDKAKQSIFKGIIASGMHTMSITFKLWNQIFNLGEDVIAGTAINNLKLTKPVYPGDILYIRSEVIKKREKRNAGEVTSLITTYKNDGIQVLQFESVFLVAK
jgi:acyl dehydratase